MKTVEDALGAAAALKENLDFAARSRWRVRAIMDGGAPAIRALLGAEMADEEMAEEDLPWANWMLTGMTRLAQKIGHYPKIRVDPPDQSDDEAPRKRAEKKRRIVRGYDEADRLELQMPQVGRWVPGYGYAVWTISSRLSPDGLPYPRASLRDPFDCYPGEWGEEQQPSEMAVWRVIGVEKAKKLYPEYAEEIGKVQYSRGRGGAVLLGQAGAGWSNQRGRGLHIVEYYDADGVHVLLPAIQRRVKLIPNPLDSGPAFVIGKRFAFNQLVGQYDHSIGLIAAQAKINILSIIMMEDGVFTETNVYGEVVSGEYEKGRQAINFLTPGSKVEKPANNLPYQALEILNRIERQFRVVTGYAVQDDGQSPLSFATGEGLSELKTGVTGEVEEYHKVLRWSIQDLDAKRLEWDEKTSPNRRKPIAPKRVGIPRVETYQPAKDIAGDYQTRRKHGLMAAWDENAKIVGGINMIQAGLLDVETVQENLAGIDEDLTEVNERIQDRKAREFLFQGLAAAAQSQDPAEKKRAIMALIEMLPASELKETLKKFYTPEEPQLSPEQAEFLGEGSQHPLADLMGGPAPPDVTTVLSRLTGAGAQVGVQTVGRV